MGGAEDAHVDGDLLLAADRAHGLFLDRPEQFDLHGHRQVGDFVEEQGATAGGLEQALLVFDSASEAAFLVAEELAFHQLGGIAPQFTGTNGRSIRGPCSWIRRATSSLPLPDSPLM